jgi:hypothetical protein
MTKYREYKHYKIRISDRPHGMYCYFILKEGMAIHSNGYFGTSVPSPEFAIKEAREWIDKLNKVIQ